MKSLLFLVCTFCVIGFSYGQSYNTVGGVRVGTEYGVTFKQRIDKRITLEGILQKGRTRNETTATVLAEKHFPLISRRLNFYLGIGAHKGWINDELILHDDPIGVTGIGGLEITFKNVNVSFDYKPAYNVSGGIDNLSSQSALSLRYVFVKRKTKVKKFIEDEKWKFWKKEKGTKRKKSSKKKPDDEKRIWEFWKKGL